MLDLSKAKASLGRLLFGDIYDENIWLKKELESGQIRWQDLLDKIGQDYGDPETLEDYISALQSEVSSLKEDLTAADESLTAAYMLGFHKRDDLIRALQSALLEYEIARQSMCIGERSTPEEIEARAREVLRGRGLL